MKLICYPTSGEPPRIIAAPIERDWMNETPERYAYRCLPLNIANSHGWMILNPVPFSATWNGKPDIDGISIQSNEPTIASSHFGNGVLTFSISGLFRTEHGYDLLVGGPTNMIKDGIQPLTGIVETDWSPFTFTMNYKFTRPFVPISFEQDEPYCMIFPIRRDTLEAIEPEFRTLEQDPEVLAAYTEWSESRRRFNEELKINGSPAQQRKWQKEYFKGSGNFGVAPQDHRTKLRLKEFK